MCFFLAINSLSKYLVKGPGPQLFFLFHLPQERLQPADRARSGSDELQTVPELESSSRILLLPHAAACTGRGRKKEIRRENASCRPLSPVLPDTFSCLSSYNQNPRTLLEIKLVFMRILIFVPTLFWILKKDQNSHLLLALGSSDHELVKLYIVRICNFITFCAG